ncbi:MAG: pyruvate formate lyase-activating protein [Candidatus Gastranaerophilales bacterium]|nr:pyruvate formate lyase-activating protein [Candidatus Gastranaerophilales bacterium]
MTKLLGNIHSIESCGTVDGPGIRFVVFFQGCPMRCAYCHNPDTWNFNVNQKMSVDDIMKKYDGVKEFLKNGGLTATGGEPMAQIDFLIELFKAAKAKDIHTALDTSGITFNSANTEKVDELLKYTNLVMLDIKHIDSEFHHNITGHHNDNILAFARYLSAKKVPMWVRHVVVPNLTNSKAHLVRLGEFLATLDNVKALDVLPYHNMAIPKYENLGIEYPLKDTPALSKEEAMSARDIILNTMREIKLKSKKPE